jgi:hypothetical protein
MADLPAFKLDDLPEDIRTEPSLKDFKDYGSLAKSYVHAVKKIGAPPEQFVRFNPDGTPTDEVWKRLGKPDKYEFPADIKSAMADDFKTEIAEFSNKYHLTKTQFEELLHFTDGRMQKLTAAQAAAQATAKTEAEKALKASLGQAYEQTVNFAKDAGEILEVPELWAEVEKLGLNTNPVFIKALGKIGKLAGEDTLVTGSKQGFDITKTPAEAGAEIRALRGDKEFMARYDDKGHPGHKDAVAKMEKLYAARAAAA